MTYQFYNKHNEAFFKGRKAITSKDIQNNAGFVIPLNTVVVIDRKYKGFGIGLETPVYEQNGTTTSRLDYITHVSYDSLIMLD